MVANLFSGPPPVLGLTGGIGSGKSTVAAMLAQLGATVIDADAVARSCTAAGGRATEAIKSTFGASFITANGAMDRERMRAHVFGNPTARVALENLLHPMVRAEIMAQIAQQAHGRLVLDLPLLAESPHWQSLCHTVWVVDCTTETQIERVQKRNAWPRTQIEAILSAQASREQRLAIANTVIFNQDIDLPTLNQEVRRHWQQWCTDSVSSWPA